MNETAETVTWLVLVWRLPSSESSARRVYVWRALRNLGAVGLTPGAAILPFTEDSQEQFDWLAQAVEDQEGDAWVLPVARLSEAEERKVRERMRAERRAEYEELRKEATEFLKGKRAPQHLAVATRLAKDRELRALQRRLRKIRARDFFGAPGHREVQATIDKALAVGHGFGATRNT